MLGFILALALAVGLAYLKVSARDKREQRNIQKAVEKALEEDRKKREEENN